MTNIKPEIKPRPSAWAYPARPLSRDTISKSSSYGAVRGILFGFAILLPFYAAAAVLLLLCM